MLGEVLAAVVECKMPESYVGGGVRSAAGALARTSMRDSYLLEVVHAPL